VTDPHTAYSFLASSLYGGTAENQNFGFRMCVHATSSQAGREVRAPTCPLF
jgi:hypothetical protein